MGEEYIKLEFLKMACALVGIMLFSIIAEIIEYFLRKDKK